MAFLPFSIFALSNKIKDLFSVCLLPIVLTLFVLSGAFLEASTWQVYTEGNGLCGRQVKCLAATGSSFAVGTENGVSIFNGANSTWTGLAIPGIEAPLNVCDIAIDEYGNYWLATNQGLINVQEKHVFLYGTAQGLSGVDINRVQIYDSMVFAGCFGGMVCRAVVPQSGYTTFLPVNYDGADESNKIKSVGIAAMAMVGPAQGWVATLGAGLLKIYGSSEEPLLSSRGDFETWFNDFFIFQEGYPVEERMIAATTEFLCLVSNGQGYEKIELPGEQKWLSAVVTAPENRELFDWVELPKLDGSEKALQDFIMRRALYVGTRSDGLWRFYRGEWRQYTSENSVLPSNCVNRLYFLKNLLAVCTDAGLVLIHINSNRYDEFQHAGFGTPGNITFYPFKPEMVYKQIEMGTDLWISHQFGLSRWRSDGFRSNQAVADKMSGQKINLSIRLEPVFEDEDGSDSNIGNGEIENNDLSGSFWQHFTNDPELAGVCAEDYGFTLSGAGTPVGIEATSEEDKLADRAQRAFPIPSQNISSFCIDRSTDCLWLIFDNLNLYRMRMQRQLDRLTKSMVQVPVWENLLKNVPWNEGERLNHVWYGAGKIFVGSSNGMYILDNPQNFTIETEPFAWQHYGLKQGLPINEVRGFAFWKREDGKILTILHNQGISTWDGAFFSKIDLGGDGTCIESGSGDDLWVGTTAGLYRLDGVGNIFTYNRNNAHFESNNITAIGVLPGDGNSSGVWVACDAFVKFSENGPGLDGSDMLPDLVPRGNGTFAVIDKILPSDIRYHSTSLHYFDGRTWEKWRIAGVRDLLIDRDYFWAATNVRVRRIRIVH